MEPVQIDIMMRQNVSEESPKVVDSIGAISASSQKAQRDLAEKIAFQKRIITELATQLKPLQEQYNRLNTATSNPQLLEARKKASQAFREVKEELEGERLALEQLEKQQGSYTHKAKQLRTELMSIRDQMARLRVAGQQEGEQYKILEQKLELLGTAYSEVNRQQKALTTGGTQMAGVISGLSALSGAISAGVGAVGLFNQDSEKIAAIQTRLQSLIAITIGLQQVSNALHSTSAFRITTVTRAKELWAAANIKVATTLGITNVQAQILMATLTMGLSVAITAVVAGLSTLLSKSKAAAKAQQELSSATASNVAQSIAQYTKLQQMYLKLSDTIQDKEKFLKEYSKSIEGLGVQVDSVTQLESLFIDQSKEFKEALLERARAAAAYDVAVDKFKQAYEKELQAKTTKPKRRDIYTPEGSWSTYDNSAAEKLNDQANKLWEEGQALLTRSIESAAKAKDKLTEMGLNGANIILDGTKAYWEEQQKAALLTLSAIKDVDVGSKAWQDAVNKYREATQKLKMWDINAEDRQSLAREKASAAAREKLSRISADIDNEINASAAAAVEDSLSRRLATLEAHYTKKQALITQREAEIAKIEKITGEKATQERAALAELSLQQESQYLSEKKRIQEAAASVVSQIWIDVNDKFVTSLESQLSHTDVYYDQQLQMLRENIANKEELQAQEVQLQQKREQEKTIIRLSAAYQALQQEEQIALAKEKYHSRDLLFESDKKEKLLLINKQYIEKRIKMLEVLQRAGVNDLDADIEQAKIQLAALGVELENIPASRLREVGGYVQQLASGLSHIMSSLSGEMSQIFSTLAGNVDNLLTVFDKNASTSQLITAGVDGLLQIGGMIASQIAENKRQQEAWTAAIRDSVHQMSLLKINSQAYERANIFGVENPYARAITGAKQYAVAMQELQKAAIELEGGKVQTGTKKITSAVNIVKGASGGAAVGAAVGSVVPIVGTVIGGAIGAVLGAIGGLFAKKRVPVWQTLKERYGEIYDAETFELNEKILADYKKLDKETKQLVDNWKEIKEKAKEAQEQMRQNFSDLAGDIGDQLSSALVNAFRNGDIYQGIDEFSSYMDKTIEDIVSKLIFAAHFQSLFDELEKRFNDSFAEGGDGDIVDDLIWFSQQYKSGVEAFSANLEQAKKELQASGIDIFNPDNRSAARGTSAQASQESITELSGGVYAARLLLSDIRYDQREILAIAKVSRHLIERITENTEYCRILEPIKMILEDIYTRGINIRS